MVRCFLYVSIRLFWRTDTYMTPLLHLFCCHASASAEHASILALWAVAYQGSSEGAIRCVPRPLRRHKCVAMVWLYGHCACCVCVWSSSGLVIHLSTSVMAGMLSRYTLAACAANTQLLRFGVPTILALGSSV
jgi:hypothetical protein